VADGALEFGTNDNRLTRIVASDPEGKLDITEEITISAWIKSEPAFGQSSTRHIAGKDQSGGPVGDGYSLKHTMGGSADLLQFLIASGGVNTNLTSSKTLSEYTADSVADGDEGWLLMTGVFRPGESMRLYINGELDAEMTDGVPTSIDPVSATPLTIGRLWHPTSTTNQFTFQGLIDDVQVYDVALTPEEVAFMYSNAGQAVPEPTTLAMMISALAVAGPWLARRRNARR
jgi:hypothetical protein